MALNAPRLRALAAKVVVPYASAYAQLHSEFAARMFPENPRRRDPRYLRWKFRSLDQDASEGFLLALRDGHVVGQIGMTPVQAQVGNKQYQAQWLCDLMVEPSFRLLGIAPMLVAQAIHRNALTLAFNPPANVIDIFEKLGFRKLLGPVMMLLPLNASHVLSQRFEKNSQRFVPVLASLARPLLAWRVRKLRNQLDREPATNCHWEDLVELVQDWQRKLSVPHVIHDRSFLQWRCPGVETYSQDIRGFRTLGGSYLLFGEELPYLYVYDWAGADWDETRKLFAQLWLFGRQVGAKTISVLANTDQEQEWLRQLGFLARRTRSSIYCFVPEEISLPFERFHFCHCDSHANL
jgi:hypothetical protein